MQHQSKIEQTLSLFYKIISGHKTEKRDWDAMRSIFYPGAVLFPISVTQSPSIMQGIDIDTYIQNLDRFLSEHDFFEQGVLSQTIIENNIASVISTYEARRSMDDKVPFKRGVNFVHFIRLADAWKITSMIWRDM